MLTFFIYTEFEIAENEFNFESIKPEHWHAKHMWKR
jgi:hypothetical protein